jgi:hypothetical protein
MRFMMLMYPGGQAEAGVMPTAKQMEDMIKYNGELGKAGVLLALDGLQPTSKGVRVTFEGGKPRVIDGPFTESKEIVGGYWIIEVKSKEEAIEWARRVPLEGDSFIELRPMFELSELTDDLREVAIREIGKVAPEKIAKHFPDRQP